MLPDCGPISVDTTEDHIVDGHRVQSSAVENRCDHVGPHVRWVLSCERAVPFTHRSAERIDDISLRCNHTNSFEIELCRAFDVAITLAIKHLFGR